MPSFRDAVQRIRQREGSPPEDGPSVRELLSRFSLDPAFSIRALLASDRIAQRYQADGRSAGPVGFPMGKVTLTADGGASQPFSGGQIVLRNDKIIPIVNFEAEVRLLGIRCNKESGHDQSTAADEPYFIVSVTNHKSSSMRLFGPFEDVDDGESRFTNGDEGILTTNAQLPFIISVIAKENDQGDPDQASAKVKKACEDAVKATQTLALAFGQMQVLAVTVMLNTVLTSIGGFIADAATAVFGLGDDFVGARNETIGDWNDGTNDWKTPSRLIESPSFSNSPYNIRIDVGDDGEGKYSLYFNVVVFRVSRELT
jgi:hypothetical protein